MARGTGIGFGLGLIPGMTGSVSSLLAYGAEKKFSRHRNELGKGAIEGVAGPETANNSHANAALIPRHAMFDLSLKGCGPWSRPPPG